MYATELQRDARQRVPPGRETRYQLEFASLAAVPEVLYVKVRFLQPRLEPPATTYEMREGHVWGCDMVLGSCRWDTRLRQEMVTLETKIREQSTSSPAPPLAAKDRRDERPPELPAGERTDTKQN